MQPIEKKLHKLCKEQGIELVKKGNNGHYQLKGKLLVNYYPLSKKQSAYVAGTTEGKPRITPEQAVEMTRTKPTGLKKAVRGRNSRKKRQAMLDRGINTCKWCHRPLTINDSTIEHVIPLDAGGLEHSMNRDLACESCNTERANDMPELKNGT